MSYSFCCIKKCFTHKRNTGAQILNASNANQTTYDSSSTKRDIWAILVPKTLQTAQTPLGRQASNVTTFAMPPPKRSASPKGGNVKHTKDMQMESLHTTTNFVVSSRKINGNSSKSGTSQMDISQVPIPSFNNETISIDFNNLPKTDSFPETMSIDFNNLPNADSSMETMPINFNNLSKSKSHIEASKAPETMRIDFNNLPKANAPMETMSIIPPETMSIDFNNLSKSDPSLETMSIDFNNLPKANAPMETMSIDFNNLPKANAPMETMSIDFNNLPKANPTSETMSIIPPETMSIGFNNLPKADPSTDTMSIIPETMSIDFNNLPKADPSSETMSLIPETMSIDFNSFSQADTPMETMSILPPIAPASQPETMSINFDAVPAISGECEDESEAGDESLPDDDAFELGIAGETLFKIRNSKIAIVYMDEDIEEIERIIKRDNDCVKKVNSVKVNRETRERLQEVFLWKEWPLVFVKGDVVGGLNQLKALSDSGILPEWLKKHDYDLIVVGGGSGGLAAAKEAARLGKKVTCLDFVKPSPQGSTWGLGGTCVNVGCIPKKLMHQASLLGHSIKDAKAFGWKIPEGEISHSWKNLKDGVQDHIANLNWGYRVQLREKLVNYVNAYGTFTGPFEISATNKKGKVEKLTADRFLIATGLRPRLPEIPGAQEYCITSDDLFGLSYPPEKTLCVGASYISLECAGFLKGLGFDVTVMVRSILLRGFDQDIAERIRSHLVEYGLKFERGTPHRIEEITPKTKEKAGLVRVYWKNNNEEGEEIECHEDYNTVVMAIGREAVIDDVKLETLGVTRSRNGKILGRREQSLGCPYVYAVGDVLEYTPELTPVAIQAGRVLMRRLYLGSDELTEYDQIPTTVFTPLEYGCCGLSEEDAFDKHGKDNIVVYHAVFNPLEYTVSERMDKDHCYCKLICAKNERDRVVGYHILAPSAGEITQGFAIALKLGGRKRDFDRLIGIHPTMAENFTTLTLIKKEGEELKASGC